MVLRGLYAARAGMASDWVRVMLRRCLLAARTVAVMAGVIIAITLVIAALSSSPQWIEAPTIRSVAPYAAAMLAVTIFVLGRDLLSERRPKE